MEMNLISFFLLLKFSYYFVFSSLFIRCIHINTTFLILVYIDNNPFISMEINFARLSTALTGKTQYLLLQVNEHLSCHHESDCVL